jgi:hypothetical protein
MTSRSAGWSFWRLSRRAFFLIGAIFLLAAVAPSVASTRESPKVLWRGGYETGPDSWGAWHVQANPGDAVVQAETVRQGRYAAEFSVSAGDVPIGTSGERAQVYVGQSLTNGFSGRDVWYAWSTMIAPGSVLDSGKWNDLTSWHQTGPVCPAPVHVAIRGSTRMLRLDAWGGSLTAANCSNPFRKSWTLGTLDFGKWYDFVFHVTWSSNPKVGSVEMWINGRQVLAPRHAATLYTGQGVYLKQGLDRGGADGKTVVYNDGMLVAANYAGAITAFPAGSWPATPGEGASSSRNNTLVVVQVILIVVLSLGLILLAARHRHTRPRIKNHTA